MLLSHGHEEQMSFVVQIRLSVKIIGKLYQCVCQTALVDPSQHVRLPGNAGEFCQISQIYQLSPKVSVTLPEKKQPIHLPFISESS
jgi:hypothetical protein